MARALESEARFQATLHAEPGVGLGRVSLTSLESDPSVAWNDDKTICAAIEGEIYDLAALRRSLGEAEGRFDRECLARLVLRLYERFGSEFAVKLNGAFVLAIWDRRTHRLLVINDRLGLCPCYYALVNGDLLFASGVRALLTDPRLNRTVDLVGMTQFLVHDHLLDDRTLLESVKLLPQASVLTVHGGQTTIRPYWKLQYPEFYEPQPEAVYVEGFIHHLRQAVARQQPGDRLAGMLLSGGLDSRLLLGLLKEFDPDIQTLTFGIPGCDDAQVAAEVAAALGTRHDFVELKPDWLLGLAEKAVRITDGLANIVNLHVLAPLEAQGRDDRILYKGFMGDALFGFALKRQMWGDYRADDRYHVHQGVHAEQGVLNYDRAAQTKFFSDALRAQVGSSVCHAYSNGMERSGASQLANQRLYFDLTQRVPRMTLNGVEAARSHAVVRVPFCDNDLLDFALTIPPGFLFERYLAKVGLVQHFPRLARIPMAGTGRPLSSCSRDIVAQVKTLASWHLKRAGLGWLAARERRPYKDYDRWFRTLLRPWVEETLVGPRSLDRGYFRPDYVRRLVSEQAEGTNHAVRLGALLTLELWHRQFLD